MPALVITTTLIDQAATIAVVGEVDIATAPQLRDAVAAAIDTYPRTVIDLTAAGYFDSSGLRVLFKFADRIAEVTVPDEGLLARAVAVSGLDQALPVRPVSRD